ncbi:class I lanthipeptide [Kordia sp.]|uniref:class I lanthipeptide n=1 Tax=Kordia sp. TaxID=1965332 RepID=UPI003D2AB367
MKVKTLQKIYFKKSTIARINEATVHQLKGGTRTLDEEKSGLGSFCAGNQCF